MPVRKGSRFIEAKDSGPYLNSSSLSAEIVFLDRFEVLRWPLCFLDDL